MSTNAQRLADKYIAPDGGAPACDSTSAINPGTILEQIIADTELLAIHGNDLDQCEACDVWLTIDESVRCEDGPTLCPHQAYGGPKFPAEPCYRDRPWRHAHRLKFDQTEAVRRTAELMEAERRGAPAQFHGGA